MIEDRPLVTSRGGVDWKGAQETFCGTEMFHLFIWWSRGHRHICESIQLCTSAVLTLLYVSFTGGATQVTKGLSHAEKRSSKEYSQDFRVEEKE